MEAARRGADGLREAILLQYDTFSSLPTNERNAIVIPSSIALLVLVLIFWACCGRCCKCLRQCCRRCCRCLRSWCVPACCRPQDGSSAYLRLERSAREVSAQCRLALRCSLKVCWISIPIPYVACSCTESDAPSGDAEQGYSRYERQQAQPPWSRGGRRTAPSDSDDSDDERRAPSGSPGKGGGGWGTHPEPVVTEVVGLQVKGYATAACSPAASAHVGVAPHAPWPCDRDGALGQAACDPLGHSACASFLPVGGLLC